MSWLQHGGPTAEHEAEEEGGNRGGGEPNLGEKERRGEGGMAEGKGGF